MPASPSPSYPLHSPRLPRRAARCLALWLLAVLIFAGGSHRHRAAAQTAALEVVSSLILAPGNITFTPDGRQLVSLHQFYSPKSRVVELGPLGKIKPFPNAAYNGPEENPTGISAGVGAAMLDAVLGVHCDRDGVVWMLDNGRRSDVTPKLVAWDTRKERLARIIHLPPPVTVPASFLADLAVDHTNGAVYIADTATDGKSAALIVIDLATGFARRVFQGDETVVPQRDVDLSIDGKVVEARAGNSPATPLRVGVNPVALDAANEWLYFGPMNGRSLYRVPTKHLSNMLLNNEELSEMTERYSDKPVCDGITMDKEGNIYVSDIAANAIGIIRPDRSYVLLASDPRLVWPNAFAWGPGGYLYVTTAQLHLSPQLNNGEDLSDPPFLIFRVKVPAAAPASPSGRRR